jgi:tetratricopeptide (TPR) repeat protein
VAYNCRGVAYFKKGEYDLAIADFNETLEINARFSEAYFFRGFAYFLREEYDKAWNDVKEAQELGYPIPTGFLEELRKVSGREI